MKKVHFEKLFLIFFKFECSMNIGWILYIFSYLLIFCERKIFFHPQITFSHSRDAEKVFKHFHRSIGFHENQLVSSFHVNSKCQLCSFTIRNRQTSNSSPKDAIMTSMFYKSFNLIPSLRTLRSTGSKCGMIVFTDSDLYKQINQQLFSFLQDCGCLIINSGDLSTSRKKSLFMTRNLVIHEFLFKNHQFFQRIIIIDLYDTIFQGDPFNTEFLDDTIGFSLETTKIQGSHINGISILYGTEKANKMCLKKLIVNCGTIIGSSQIVLRFLSLFLELANTLSNSQYDNLINTGFPDQAIVNGLICTHALDDHGIKYHLYTAQEEYISLHKIYRAPNLNFSLGNFLFNSSQYPLLIHLFDRSKKFCQSVLDACPQTFDIPFSYIRCLNVHK